MGALDVCPFVPVSNVSVEECVEIANDFGQRLAAELDIPVFLYGYASDREYRKTMPQVKATRMRRTCPRTSDRWKLT